MFVARFKVYSAYVGSGVFGSVLAYSLAGQGQGKQLSCEGKKRPSCTVLRMNIFARLKQPVFHRELFIWYLSMYYKMHRCFAVLIYQNAL